jgi:hypothetical protein
MTFSAGLGLGEGVIAVGVGETGVGLGLGVGIEVGDGDGLTTGLGLTAGVGELLGDGLGPLAEGPAQAATTNTMAMDVMTIDGRRMTRSFGGPVQHHDRLASAGPHLPDVTM